MHTCGVNHDAEFLAWCTNMLHCLAKQLAYRLQRRLIIVTLLQSDRCQSQLLSCHDEIAYLLSQQRSRRSRPLNRSDIGA